MNYGPTFDLRITKEPKHFVGALMPDIAFRVLTPNASQVGNNNVLANKTDAAEADIEDQ